MSKGQVSFLYNMTLDPDLKVYLDRSKGVSYQILPDHISVWSRPTSKYEVWKTETGRIMWTCPAFKGFKYTVDGRCKHIVCLLEAGVEIPVRTGRPVAGQSSVSTGTVFGVQLNRRVGDEEKG